MAAFKGSKPVNNAAFLIGPTRNAFLEAQPILSEALGQLQENRAKGITNDLLAQAFSQYQPQEQIAAPLGQAMSEAPMSPEVTREATASGLFPESLIATESGGNWAAQNNETGSSGRKGHFGRLQFGKDRLDESRKALGKDFTTEEFLQNPELQQEVENWHFNDINSYISKNGLDQFLGKEVKGTVMTPGSMQAVAHLGGKAGLKRFLTDPDYNPSDSFGTHLTDYASKHANGGSSDVTRMATAGGAMPAPTQAGPRPESFLESDAFKQALMNTAARGGDVSALIQEAETLDKSLANDALAAETAHQKAETAWHGADKASTIASRDATTAQTKETTRWIGPKAQSGIDSQQATTARTRLETEMLGDENTLVKNAQSADSKYNSARDAYIGERTEELYNKIREETGEEPTSAERILINKEVVNDFDQNERPRLMRQMREEFPNSFNRTEQHKEDIKVMESELKISEDKYKLKAQLMQKQVERLGPNGEVPEITVDARGNVVPLYGNAGKRIARKRGQKAIETAILNDSELSKTFEGGEHSEDFKTLTTLIKGAADRWQVDPDVLIERASGKTSRGLWGFRWAGAGGITDFPTLSQIINEEAETLARQVENVKDQQLTDTIKGLFSD